MCSHPKPITRPCRHPHPRLIATTCLPKGCFWIFWSRRHPSVFVSGICPAFFLFFNLNKQLCCGWAATLFLIHLHFSAGSRWIRRQNRIATNECLAVRNKRTSPLPVTGEEITHRHSRIYQICQRSAIAMQQLPRLTARSEILITQIGVLWSRQSCKGRNNMQNNI